MSSGILCEKGESNLYFFFFNRHIKEIWVILKTGVGSGVRTVMCEYQIIVMYYPSIILPLPIHLSDHSFILATTFSCTMAQFLSCVLKFEGTGYDFSSLGLTLLNSLILL